MARILFVEDEDRLRLPVAPLMGRQGWVADWVQPRATALGTSSTAGYDVVVLDWNLQAPALGLDLCRKFRRSTPPPGIVVLCNQSDIANKVAAFEAGADDYLTMPFEPIELYLRLHSFLRRSVPAPEPLTEPSHDATVSWHGLTARFGDRARVDGTEVDLTPLQERVFVRLLRNAGRVVSFEELWLDFRVAAAPNAVNVRMLICALRKRLKTRASSIEAFPGRGYGVGVNGTL